MSKFATFLGAAAPSSSQPFSFGSLGKLMHSLSSSAQLRKVVMVSSPKAAKHPVEQVGSPPHRARHESPLVQSLFFVQASKEGPQPDSSAKQGPSTDTHGPVDHGRHGGRSENPPPVSSAEAMFRRASDQCFCPHVFFTTVAAGAAVMLLLSIAIALLAAGSPITAPARNKPTMNVADACLKIESSPLLAPFWRAVNPTAPSGAGRLEHWATVCEGVLRRSAEEPTKALPEDECQRLRGAVDAGTSGSVSSRTPEQASAIEASPIPTNPR
mmetsp:Transcript_7680/g.18596  ORF Transcript_7680/g.18596 Transcript_7680/m.18596 type:complete len:270 (-) Transcript_7680:17-826(-)